MEFIFVTQSSNATAVVKFLALSSKTSLELLVIARREAYQEVYLINGPGMFVHFSFGATFKFGKAYCRLPLMLPLRMLRGTTAAQSQVSGVMADHLKFYQEIVRVLENILVEM